MSCAASAPTSAASYFVVVPASPIETGVAATHGPLDVMEATQEAAKARLDHTLSTLRSENLDADGALGDYRPLRALANAVDTFRPDQIVIATLPLEDSVWHRFDVVDRARAEYPNVPVTHVVATPVAASRPSDDDHRGVQLEPAGQRAAQPGGAAGPHHRREDHRRGGRGAGAAGRCRSDRGRVPGLHRVAGNARRSSGWSTRCAATSTSP